MEMNLDLAVAGSAEIRQTAEVLGSILLFRVEERVLRRDAV
jgi:hypothetical protein